MYLTRVLVGLDEALRHGLKDAYAWHQAVWRAFPGRDGAPRCFLTRVDQAATDVTVFILAAAPPTPCPWGTWETRKVQPAFLSHRRYVYSLRANPTVKRVVRDESGRRRKNGRRTRICGYQDLAAWLQRKGEEAGFRVDDGVEITPPVDQTCWRERAKVVHASVDFRGRLTVTEPERFRAAYRSGIGPAKGFGFGLLLLKPLPEGGRVE